MSDNEQELLKLETEVYHSDGGIYFAECDSASTRGEMARRLGNGFFNKNVKVIKINVGMTGVESTRDEIARWLDDVSLDKDGEKSELDVHVNDLTYTVTRYPGDDAAFFVYLPSEKSELEEFARILNYTREEFAEVKQPILIWADKVSLGIIARYAPDFWAWRARVSEFAGGSDGRGYGGEVEAEGTVWRAKISDEEIQAYERALEEFKNRGDEKEAAKTLRQLGLLHYRRCEWDLAIEYYEKSMKIKEALGDRHGLAQTYNNLGAVYARKGEWDLAIEYYEKDMEISEALGDRHGLAQTYNNLGAVYARKGEWDIAIEYYEKDMEISEALGDRHGLAQTYGNLGAVYADKGEWDLAIEYYEKDMEISEALGDRHSVGITLSNIGRLYLDRSDPMGAKENLKEAIWKIHPDARPEYPNALNWLAVSLRRIAEQKKREAKLASSDVERDELATAAAELYGEAAERYKETYNLPLARMPRSLMMDAHLARGLAFSVQNITEEDSKKAIALLDRAITEMGSALEFADDADAIRLNG
ncbi:MAG: tetratricopeptide repeat protein, partial [Euryarchaeota archaeon]|nr:tetratricopeptide repeat protein [Euryarchaeota archaeon]